METEKTDKPVITKNDVRAGLEQIGVRAGDVVFFHSSLSSMGYVEGGADTVIDAFLETVGEKGTVVVPTLYFGKPWDAWDRNETPSDVGPITETFRKRDQAVRSNHPTHSVAAIGYRAEQITKCAEDATGTVHPHMNQYAAKGAFGPGSVWGRLYDLDAKYMFLGVDFQCCTMFHHVEETLLRDFRQRDENAPWPGFDFAKIGGELEKRGLVRMGRIGEATVRLAQSRQVVDTALALLREDFLNYVMSLGLKLGAIDSHIEQESLVNWYRQHVLGIGETGTVGETPAAHH